MMIKAFAILILSLCVGSCSVDHPRVYLPYSELRSPRGTLSKYHIYEISALENRELDIYEKRRLRELYSLALKEQKAGTDYFIEVSNKKNLLEKELGDFRISTDEEGESPIPEKSIVFEEVSVRNKYSQALKAWNNDDYKKAVQLVTELLEKDLSRNEKVSLYFLKLRVLLEMKEWDLAIQTYSQLAEVEACHEKTQDGNFLLTLSLLGEKKTTESKQVWEKLCINDKMAASARFRYWQGRITNDDSLREIKEPDALLSYYKILQGLNSEAPLFFTQKIPLFSPTVRVSSRSHEKLQQVEVFLSKRLYSDSYELLRQVEKTVREEDLETKEYISQLYFSSGHFFRAFRLLGELWGKQIDSHTVFPYFDYRTMYPYFYRSWLDLLSQLWEIDRDFLLALMRQESGFNPNAVSSSGARGLMQLMPFVAKSLSQKLGFSWYQEKGLFYPKENTKLGAYHVKQLDLIYGHPALIAASYNAGSSRVSRWLDKWGNYPLDVFVEMIPIEETRTYVKIVLRNWVCYKIIGSAEPFPKGAIPFDLRKKAIPVANF